MFKKLTAKRLGLLGLCLTFVGVVAAGRSTWFRRDVVNGSMVHVLENDGTTTQTGATQFGSDEDSPSMPTSTTADDFGVKVPFYNASGAATVRGQVIISSSTALTFGYASSAAVLSTTTVIGVADGVYANGAVGWMTVSGYAMVLTTGTVNIGDVLVSTNGSNGAGAAGYAGADPTPDSGADIGVAMSIGTASGGLTAVRLR